MVFTYCSPLGFNSDAMDHSLGALPTEFRNPLTNHIDTVSTMDMCKIINDQDAMVAKAVSEVLPTIAAAIDAIVERVNLGGRLLYMGAGNSGR